MANPHNLQGYVNMLGKFQGDSFEQLKVKCSKTEMHVLSAAGDLMIFDLMQDSYVYTDPNDPTCFVLEYAEDSIIIFKVTEIHGWLAFRCG